MCIKFTISTTFKCVIQWFKYIHIFCKKITSAMINVHYNWVEKNELEDKSAMTLFPSSHLKQYVITALELESQNCR